MAASRLAVHVVMMRGRELRRWAWPQEGRPAPPSGRCTGEVDPSWPLLGVPYRR